MDSRSTAKPTLGRLCSAALSFSLVLCLLPSFGALRPAFADEGAPEVLAILLTPEEQAAIAKTVLEADTSNIVDVDSLMSFLEMGGISKEGFLALDVPKLPDCDEGQRREIQRLQDLLKPAEMPKDHGAAEDASNSTIKNPPQDSEAPSAESPALERESSSAESTSQQSAPTFIESPSQDNPSQYPAWSYDGDTTFKAPASADFETSAFIAVIAERSRALAQEHGIFASVMIAQAVLESDSGNSELAKRPNFNLFNTKGEATTGSVRAIVAEYDQNGIIHDVEGEYRKYDSFSDSLRDYAEWVGTRCAFKFQGALKAQAEDYVAACEWMQGRYSNDPEYAKKLTEIIDDFDLTRYDASVNYELVEPIMQPVMAEDGASYVRDSETDEIVLEEKTLLDLVDEVSSHLGDPYVWGGAAPGSFDCSGLVQYSYHTALEVDIPRTTHYQCLIGEDVDFADLHAGDLLFFTDKNGVCTHVGMYLAEGCFIEAPHTGDVVKVSSMESKRPAFAKRVMATKEKEFYPIDEQGNESDEPLFALKPIGIGLSKGA